MDHSGGTVGADVLHMLNQAGSMEHHQNDLALVWHLFQKVAYQQFNVSFCGPLAAMWCHLGYALTPSMKS